MKKFLLSMILGLTVATAANAQYTYDTPPFGQGKIYVGASMSGFDIGSSNKTFHVDLATKGGYMLMDNILALGELSYNYREHTDGVISLGAGARYYIEQNGIYLGAGVRLADMTNDLDVQPNASVGYAFFLNRTVTVEPELYFNLSTKDFDYSSYGFRIGVGIYLFNE
jgi:hypothetical protein